jgi:hypothetical protein
MNKQQALDRLAAIEKETAELRKIVETPEQPTVTPEELFRQLMNGLVCTPEKNGNLVYCNSQGEWMIEIEEENSCIIWFHYDRFWVKFHEAFSWKYEQTQAFLKDMLEKHFKMKDVTPKNWVEVKRG